MRIKIKKIENTKKKYKKAIKATTKIQEQNTVKGRRIQKNHPKRPKEYNTKKKGKLKTKTQSNQKATNNKPATKGKRR